MMDRDSEKILLLVDQCDRGNGRDLHWPLGQGAEGKARFSALLLNLQYEGYLYEENGQETGWFLKKAPGPAQSVYFGEYHLTEKGRQWVSSRRPSSE